MMELIAIFQQNANCYKYVVEISQTNKYKKY